MKEKILFICHRIPYPPNKGDKIRSFHELQYMAKTYDIHLVSFYDVKTDIRYKAELDKYCSSVYLFHLKKIPSLLQGFISLLTGGSISIGCYKNRKAKKLTEKLIAENAYSFILCYSSQVIQYAGKSSVIKIIDFIDLDSDKWRQYAQKSIFPLNLIYQIEYKRLAAYEKKSWDRFDLSVFSTAQEKKLFIENGIPDNKLAVLGNGVDHTFFSPIPCKREKTLIFTGAMDYFPNIDAVTWFCTAIFPEILKIVPDVRFFIVGSNPTKEIKALASSNVIVTGFVDDIRPYIARSALAVYPLRIARGIQNKILEAMAMGITPVIPESLRNSLDENWPDEVLIFGSEAECKDIIIKKLQAFDENLPIEHNLRKHIIKYRDWDGRLNEFLRRIEAIPGIKCNG